MKICIKEEIKVGDTLLETGDIIKIVENGGKFACVMVFVSNRTGNLASLRREVPIESIYSHLPLEILKTRSMQFPVIAMNALLEDLGYEKSPHITVAYGLENDGDLPLIKQDMDKILTPIFIEDGTIAIFENVEYGECDCLVIQVNQTSILKIIHNKILRKYANTQTYKDYKPHITIAYIKKRTCREFIGRQVELNLTITKNDFIYSPKHGLNEELDTENLKKERNELQNKINNSPFPDPEDIAKLKELNNLIIGLDLDQIEMSKFKSSDRVTPFNRKRQ